jgi:hypothetical protein
MLHVEVQLSQSVWVNENVGRKMRDIPLVLFIRHTYSFLYLFVAQLLGKSLKFGAILIINI